MSDAKKTVKEYTNGEVTIVWKPDACIHSKLCFNGLSQVFDPQARPWVNAEGASTEAIIAQVNKCPSGALSYYLNDDAGDGPVKSENERIVEISQNGPLMVYGNLTIKYPDGREEKQHRVTAFCRCGSSSNKPFCDGTHRKVGFEG